MKNAPDKLQWHPAFCAAAGLEFHEDIERLELKPEYNLSKEPIRTTGSAALRDRSSQPVLR